MDNETMDGFAHRGALSSVRGKTQVARAPYPSTLSRPTVMRQRDIQVLLHRHAAHLKPTIGGIGSNSGSVDFSNRDAIADAARALQVVPALTKKAETLLNHRVFASTSTVITQEAANEIQKDTTTLAFSASVLVEFLDATLPPAPELYIAAKLPPAEHALDGEARWLGRLKRALDHPLQSLGHPPLQVIHFDRGSVWVELGVANLRALEALGVLLGGGIAVAKAVKAVAIAKQELAKVDQEKAKVAQEIARADQEEAKADQERAKADQERARIVQEESRAAIAQLELKKLELGVANLRAQTERTRLLVNHSEVHELENVLSAATQEIADLYADGGEFKGQLDPPPQAAAMLPDDVRPERPVKEIKRITAGS